MSAKRSQARIIVASSEPAAGLPRRGPSD